MQTKYSKKWIFEVNNKACLIKEKDLKYYVLSNLKNCIKLQKLNKKNRKNVLTTTEHFVHFI